MIFLRWFGLLACLSMHLSLSAQPKNANPIRWTFETKQVAQDQYELLLRADLDADWAVYAQKLESDNGPIPTSIQFEFDEAQFELLGAVEERGEKIEVYDDLFEMKVTKYKKTVTFVQKVKALHKGHVIQGNVTYMCCNHETCLPPVDVPFLFELK